MKTLTDQMARLNQDLVGQLTQTNQSITQINSRLDRLEACTPARIPKAQVDPEIELELDTPINLRRAWILDLSPEPNPRRELRQDLSPEPNPRGALCQDLSPKPHPRRFNQEPFFNPNPWRPNIDRVYDPNPRRIHHNLAYNPNPRRPDQDQMYQDDRAHRRIKLEASTFDGKLDPKAYVDWEGEMDQFFKWYDMNEERKCRFTKLKLVHQARLLWGNVERSMRLRGDDPIVTWMGIKHKLRRKYLPMSYNQRLLDQWQRLTQGTKSVVEYIA